MRRKIVPATAKTLVRSGLECATCTYWEQANGAIGAAGDGSVKEAAMRRLIKDWGGCGKIVYVDGEALAYAQYGPAQYWPAALRFAAGSVSDDAVLLTCLHVVPYARGRGLGRVLLQSTEASLVRRKVRAIEVFATRREANPPGPLEFYLQNGFYIVRDDPNIPLLRLELKALVGWQINIQFALDGLKIPATRTRPGLAHNLS